MVSKSVCLCAASVALLCLGGCGDSQASDARAAEPARVAGAVPDTPPAYQPVTLAAADGVQVHAAYYRAQKPRAIILLFHQAGSNKAEYASIAPRLVAAGYSALAIDQRSGGDRFGARNETVEAIGRSADYLDALPDLEAALAWGKTQHLPVVVWGSSYSSALVFLLAARHPADVAALLSFSPGEYLGGARTVRDAASQVHGPVFITSAISEDEIGSAHAIWLAVGSTKKTQFVPERGGVHGSSTLIASANRAGAEENWAAVTAFLADVIR